MLTLQKILALHGTAFIMPCCFYLFLFVLVMILLGQVTYIILKKLFPGTKTKAGISIFIGFIAGILVIIIHLFFPFSGDEMDYWKYRGGKKWPLYLSYGYRRIPLEYPYEIIIDEKKGNGDI